MHPQDPLSTHFRIDEIHKKALKRLRIETVGDLLLHLPQRYEDISDIQSVSGLSKGQDAVVFGQIGGLKARKAWKSRKPIAEGWIEDGSARIKVMWFNQPYLAKMLTDGTYVKLAGKVTGTGDKLYIANPEIEKLDSLPVDRHDSIFKNTENLDDTIYPVYRESKGVTSKWFYHTVLKCFEKGILEKMVDPIPETILNEYNLPKLPTALQWIHTPKKAEHAESARKRFAFEEVFYIQVQKAIEREAVSAATTYQFKTEKEHIDAFINRFPFPLTGAQQKAIDAILKDFNGKHAMSRLLEGDVGSGKTAVAASTAYAVVTSRPPEGLGKKIEFGNLQVAYMAPTEILAKQHFESFIEYFHHLPIQIGLITGSGCMKFPSKVDATKPTKISRAQLLKWVKSGEIPILIGTHALIYKSVEFKHLAHVIIDEQHRFGTNQRKALAKKDARMPHLLSMTATPIPRTLALTVYGDLDITLLDEMPAGRKPVITKIVTPDKQDEMYEHVRAELATGRQAYVICPRINEPDPDKEVTLQLKSVEAEAARLKKDVFKTSRIGILHGKMKPADKDKIMLQFANHDIDVLVATSVVEVGVNVPNATNIIIEGAERFGLAQLHQLRGRVIRGTHQAYCFAVTESKSDKTKERLKALSTAKNGFELAEHDLTFRGSGELYGSKQSGLTDLGMEALKNLKLVEAARNEARALVAKDVDLKKHPLIKLRIAHTSENLHME
ncbi:ATP-dependent DNA helicase RecG [Candidatus Parcubacteria bacterium]|uniref:Probable DNA 3'-5' helicase RecG n=1 Tax=Candidatus Kaiserbacteria bacterium CG10_big_fil_rev_8_21_14_0_10_47_16 TaxID=1974608 RepID=A0A2H0UFC0_9BACT|nr:ATP-dependent DNA helicase RecG [Candidatus Parcubacteria bacterium]PIR84485.1 MAG: ATP-dependent DNA helicase RecG [Candidatus Kaiserbacteria bacterium CG10_big_fil_rev_8_21_14_0_10_47_16]